MRADRLISLILLLKRANQPVSAGKLARELEVSSRTIMRDVEALTSAGVPVYCERGPHGGIALMPGFRSDLTGLQDGELSALFLSVGAARSRSLGLHTPLASALRKLIVAVPEPQRELAFRLASRIVVDADGWLPGNRVPWLAEARRAVTDQTTVRFRYHSATTGRTQRVTTPAAGLLCAASAWYLVGVQKTEAKFYRLDRVEDLRLSAEKLAVPADFDVESRWRDARARFRKRFAPVMATLAMSSRALAQLRGLCSITSVREERRSGWNRVTALFGDLSHACEVLPRIAGELRVIEPPALRNELRAQAAALLCATED